MSRDESKATVSGEARAGDGQPTMPGADVALDTLIYQFSDRMSFYRELIQNSLDAGSSSIEIDFEFTPAEPTAPVEPAQGAEPDEPAEAIEPLGGMVIQVDDFGEGMDREIIEGRLTRLFSSSKDGDLTKIGRFGIGFVSVFAIEPEAVVLDTARGGESWRVVFDEQRAFVIYAMDEPVDGTRIRIYKSVIRADYDAFVARSREVVQHWCRHAKAEILFRGESVNRPLELDSPCWVHHQEKGTEVVLGYPVDGKAFCGFYNRGLTLYEGTDQYLPDLAFKIDSRYLEHTLSRDQVVQEEHFLKAMAIVRGLAAKELPARLFELLEARVANGGEVEPLYSMACTALDREPGLSKRMAERKVLADATGRPIPLGEARRAGRGKKLYYDTATSPLMQALLDDGILVVRAAADSWAARLLQRLSSSPVHRANEVFCQPVAPDASHEAARYRPLEAAVQRLFGAHSEEVTELTFAHFAYEGSSIAHRVAITQKQAGEVTRLEEIQKLSGSVFSRKRVLVVNLDHPTVAHLVALASREPELSAYVLLKLFHLRGELSPELDGQLMAQAHGLREQRVLADGGGL